MIFCASCDHALTVELVPVAADFEPAWQDYEEIVPAGSHWSSQQQLWNTGGGVNTQVVVINSGDQTGLVSDGSRDIGCCGNSKHVRNQLCGSCHARVGTHIDDCYTSFFLYFPDGQVVTRQEKILLGE